MPNKENMFSILHQLGFNEQEIYLFKSKGYKFDLNPIDEMPVYLIDIINKLHDIKYVSYTELFDNVIKTFDLFSLSGIKNMEYTYFILEKVRSEIESLSIITEKEFVSYLRERIKGSIDFEATSIDRVATLSNDSDAVSVANLHKVKGLEARIVILYDENEKDKDPEKYIDRELDERYIFGFSNGFTNVARTNEYMDLQDIARRKDFEEVRRLLYVAATRAKERLFICRDSSVKNSYWDPLRLAYDINGNIIYEIEDYEIKQLDPIVPELGYRSSLKVLNDDIKKETYKIVLPSKEVKDIKSRSLSSFFETCSSSLESKYMLLATSNILFRK
jgi:ATP-dependent exoDNAse (exonuclease V) beta subunit